MRIHAHFVVRQLCVETCYKSFSNLLLSIVLFALFLLTSKNLLSVKCDILSNVYYSLTGLEILSGYWPFPQI